MNLKKKNNQHLSIKNSKFNSPIKPNHNLILSEDYSNQNRTFNINNNTISPYSDVQRNNFLLNPYKSSYDINNNNINNNDIENNDLEKIHENNILFKRNMSKIQLKRGYSKAEYNSPFLRKIETKKKNNHTNTNLVNILNGNNDKNVEINFNKYEIKILSEQQKKNLLNNQLINNDSSESKFNSINSLNSKDESMKSDDNDNGFILSRNRKNRSQKNEFNLRFRRKNTKKKISLNTENRIIQNNNSKNNFSISKNDTFNISSLNRSNKSKSRNRYSFSNEDNLSTSNQLIRKTLTSKPRTLILSNPLRRISNCQSENDELFPKKVKTMKYTTTDSDSNYHFKNKEGFINKIKTWNKNKVLSNSRYSQIFFRSKKKKSDDYLNNNILIHKKEQTPYQITQLKNSLLNKQYLPLSNMNFENNTNFEDDESELLIDDNNNNNNNNKNYKHYRGSYIETLSPEQALSLLSIDNNSYNSENQIIYYEEGDNKIKKTNKRFIKQLSRIPEVKERRNNNNSLFGTLKIQSTKLLSNKSNIKEHEKKILLNQSLPLPKISDLNIKFHTKKKKEYIKLSSEELMDNPSDDSNETNSYSFNYSKKSFNFFKTKSNSVKYSIQEFKFQRNNLFLLEKSKKLIKYLYQDIDDSINMINFNTDYTKDDFVCVILEHNKKKLNKIEEENEEKVEKKEYQTLKFKKHLFTSKNIPLSTKERIMNYFLLRILFLEKKKLRLKITLPLYIKDSLLEKHFNINLYDKIINGTYLAKDLSEEANGEKITKHFLINKKKKKTTPKEKNSNTKLHLIYLFPLLEYINKFLIFDSIEINCQNIYIEKIKFVLKQSSLFNLKTIQKFQTKKSFNLFQRRRLSLSTNKTYTMRKDRKKKSTIINNNEGILQKKFFNRRRNALVNEQLLKFHQKKKLQKLTYLRKRGEVLFQSPLKMKRNHKKENLIEQSVIRRVFNRESMMYETHKIKSELIKGANTFIDILFLYIKDGNYQNFQDMFLKFNPGIEERDENQNSFLNIAVQCGCKEIILFLLEKGANTNSQNKKLNTPLHYALSFQNYDIADLLLKYGADESIKNSDGLTPWQCLKSTHTLI